MIFRIRDRYRPGARPARPRGATQTMARTGFWQALPVRESLARIPWRQLLLVLAVALAAGTAPWAVDRALQAMDREIRGISVRGDLQWADPDALEARLDPWLGRSFFAADLSRVKAMVEAGPWIESAAVRRVWPGELIVEVQERRPVAHWNQGSLLSDRGQVFAPRRPPALATLPRLQGPEGEARTVLEQARQFSAQLQRQGLRLASVTLEPRGAWSLTLDNGVEIVLGREATGERMERVLRIYHQELRDRAENVARIDARYGNGVAVRWREPAGGPDKQT